MSLPDLAPEWRAAFRWLEQTLGGRVVRAEAQPRWRPAWLIDLERDGEVLPLYWRGDRGLSEGINDVYDLRREEQILRVLEAHAIPVPHIHAVREEPRALVMERCPGRANLATAHSDAERERVLDHYIEILVAIHAIDPERFAAAGIAPPTESVALGDLELWERIYRKAKRRPEPLIEFALRWVRRQAPRREHAAFALGDSGQFLFENGRVTAVLDVEYGNLGDPVADLAGLRAREVFEPLGDLSRAVRRYAKLSGRRVDRELLSWHTARFALYTPLSIAHVVADPDPGVDWAQYRSFFIAQARLALQAMAEFMDVELPGIEVPPETPTPRTPAHDALVGALTRQRDDAADPVDAYAAECALRIAEHLRRVDVLGPALDADERADRRALLGDTADGDAELESLVCVAGPQRDEELLRYFQRRILREHELFRPAMREMADAIAQPIRFEA